jgi:carboxyl-terminal processing protease
MGKQTFGKGSVQTMIAVEGCGPDPCGLKLTVSRYYTPSGRSIQSSGITPNVVVEPSAPEARSGERDVVREEHYDRHLKNEQGEKPPEPKLLNDHPLQMAMDYLKAWTVFSQQGKQGKTK